MQRTTGVVSGREQPGGGGTTAGHGGSSARDGRPGCCWDHRLPGERAPAASHSPGVAETNGHHTR